MSVEEHNYELDENPDEQLAGRLDLIRGASIDSLGPGILEILDALPFYVLLIDRNHRILLANKATVDAVGMDPDSMIGGYCPQIIHGIEEGSYPGCPLEEAVESKAGAQREHFDEKHNRWLRISIYPTAAHTSDGEQVFFHMVEDITEKKEMMEALEETKEIYRRLFEGSGRHERK